MAHLIVHLFKPGAIAVGAVALAFLILAVVRSTHLPQCFACGAMKVRQSRPAGLLDHILSFCLVRPHRCEGCLERFYALRWRGEARASSPLRPRRGVAFVFRRHNGVIDRVAIRLIDLKTETVEAEIAPIRRNPGALSARRSILPT